jgi:hypothetical protein
VTCARQREALGALFRGLEALYQTDTGLHPHDLLIEADATADGPREQLWLREAEDGELEVGLVLDRQLLRRVAEAGLGSLLRGIGLVDGLPVVEGLSHLLYVAEAARRDKQVSGLELETQAEVDKLAVCLLHHWGTADRDFDELVDRLYYRFELVTEEPRLQRRYHTANRLALGFSRRLRPHVQARRLPGVRAELRGFWGSSMPGKRALAS